MTSPYGFYLPWLAAVMVTEGAPAASAPTIVHFQGLDIPVVQAVLAIAGVLMARPLARKNESTLPIWQFLVVSLIMMVIAVAWVLEAQPGILFTFVVAIGLGFSGYAAIETAGTQIQDFITRIFSAVTGVLGSIGAKK